MNDPISGKQIGFQNSRVGVRKQWEDANKKKLTVNNNIFSPISYIIVNS